LATDAKRAAATTQFDEIRAAYLRLSDQWKDLADDIDAIFTSPS